MSVKKLQKNKKYLIFSNYKLGNIWNNKKKFIHKNFFKKKKKLGQRQTNNKHKKKIFLIFYSNHKTRLNIFLFVCPRKIFFFFCRAINDYNKYIHNLNIHDQVQRIKLNTLELQMEIFIFFFFIFVFPFCIF